MVQRAHELAADPAAAEAGTSHAAAPGLPRDAGAAAGGDGSGEHGGAADPASLRGGLVLPDRAAAAERIALLPCGWDGGAGDRAGPPGGAGFAGGIESAEGERGAAGDPLLR